VTAPTSPPDSPGNDSADLLNGWKDIAAYVGKSVRSLQRWERELGFPTRRIKTPDGGQIVFASRREIDAWRRSQSSLTEMAAVSEAIDTPTLPLPVGPGSAVAARPSIWRSRANWLLITTAGILVVGFLFYSGSRSVRASTVSVDVASRSIRGLDAAGRATWTFTLPSDDVPASPMHFIADHDSDRASYRADLNGDGLTETVVGIRLDSPRGPTVATDRIYALSDDGQLLWSVTDVPPIECNGATHTGPWRLQAIAVSSERVPRRVWAAYTHHTSWPSVVVEISSSGTQTIRYFQSGWVMTLAEWTTPGRRVLVAGGVMNEPGQSSIAILDPSGAPARSPVTAQGFACANVPAGVPERVLLFPSLEVERALGDDYVMVNQVSQIGANLKVEINTSMLILTLTPAGHVSEALFSDKHWNLHRTLEAEGRIRHPAHACRLGSHPLALREWTPSLGWRDIVGPTAQRAAPVTR
jgi:hypothetical protein